MRTTHLLRAGDLRIEGNAYAADPGTWGYRSVAITMRDLGSLGPMEQLLMAESGVDVGAWLEQVNRRRADEGLSPLSFAGQTVDSCTWAIVQAFCLGRTEPRMVTMFVDEQGGATFTACA